MLSKFSFKLTKPLQYLICNLKRSGAVTEKHDFVNLTVLSMEIPLEIVCHFSFEIMGFFIRFSCYTLSDKSPKTFFKSYRR